MTKEIFGMKAPVKTCTDLKCPYHGDINVKMELFKGKIVKKDINRSATLEWFRSRPVSKYERLELRRSRMRVHNPACINAEVGDEVMVAKTRPLSKTKNHVVIGLLKHQESAKVNVSENVKENDPTKEKLLLKKVKEK
jgi:small subunit ribosomal protein S17